MHNERISIFTFFGSKNAQIKKERQTDKQRNRNGWANLPTPPVCIGLKIVLHLLSFSSVQLGDVEPEEGYTNCGSPSKLEQDNFAEYI